MFRLTTFTILGLAVVGGLMVIQPPRYSCGWSISGFSCPDAIKLSEFGGPSSGKRGHLVGVHLGGADEVVEVPRQRADGGRRI